MNTLTHPNRRHFLKLSAIGSAGLALAIHLPLSATNSTQSTAANAFIEINPDNSVTFTIKHIEMGQGTYTGLATLLADEMDAAWEQVSAVPAPAEQRYGNLSMGGAQITGGSSAIFNSYQQMRQAGAAAKAMLVAAAAKRWQVSPDSITVSQGIVSHAPSNNRASFGELATLAAQQTVPNPDTLTLKTPQQFVYIGKQVERKDTGKNNGTALFTQDVFIEGMQVAVVARPPRFGATVKSVDSQAATAIAGVTAVLTIPSGVAVLARDYWSARKGRQALTIDWDESAAFRQSSDDIYRQFHALAATPGLPAAVTGDTDKALAAAETVIERSFQFPFLAHAPMEPMNCIMQYHGDSCDIWSASQGPSLDQAMAAKVLGLKPDTVRIHGLIAGGSFGRRLSQDSDYVAEAASIAKQQPGTAVKLVWSREDDIQGGYYRPAYVHALKAGLDKKGRLIAWQQRIVGQSVAAGSIFASSLVNNGIDNTSVEGASNLPYQVDNLRVELHTVSLPVPVLWWRSVGHTHTAFTTETFIDEIAAAAGKDPVALRMELLAGHSRHQGVLKLATDKARWGGKLPDGVYQGVAVHESFRSFVAQVADVKVNADGSFKVLRVVCAVDCGIAVNPDVIRAQIEGGIGFAMSPLLKSEITFTDGKVNQSNFHDYQVIRMPDMPTVEVHIVPSTEAPTGIGEPGVPPLAPAVANALFAATGNMPQGLPIKSA